MKKDRDELYGIFLLDGYKALVICNTKEEAERIKGDKTNCEVRRIITTY